MALPVLPADSTSTLCTTAGSVLHPGLPSAWAAAAFLLMVLLAAPGLRPGSVSEKSFRGRSLASLPLLGPLLRRVTAQPWLLAGLRVFSVAVFLLVIAAGLFGTPLPERNLATVLTWTFWWTGVVLAVLLLGSAWCAVCPWDALAAWLVRRRLWQRGAPHTSLSLPFPAWARNLWPALAMFVGLTWLELGVGVTTSPYATAVLGLLMVLLATASLALFERKGFCRYVCPIGRTLGSYSTVVPVALRPVDPDVCARCTTLECYHGNAQVEPCPTHLVIGRTRQNQHCTSCGACTQSCPHDNISWHTRPLADEAMHHTRAHGDGAWFVLGLVALTSFHGITMLPYWEGWMVQTGRLLGDSGQLLRSFSLGMALSLALPVALFATVIWLTRRLGAVDLPYRRLFNHLALATLPLAFAYHLAHNLSHLLRESRGALTVFANPFGNATQPLSLAERHVRMLPLIPAPWLYGLQIVLLVLGLWLAIRVLRQRAARLGLAGGMVRLPLLAFLLGVSALNLWLLCQPMVMRL